MTNWQLSESRPSQSFSLLDERIQKWIWERGWPNLHDIQEVAIPAILECRRDIIISAPTSLGKTEAAFLPILTKLLKTESPGIRALYLSPLKALINDQFERLDLLCERLEFPLHRWHGDVGTARKQTIIRAPSGALLMTPESLEALFVNHGTKIERVFEGLNYVVLDEAHAFIGTERGRQVQSLLHRIEQRILRRVPRIALSATLKDFTVASEFIRPGFGAEVVIIRSSSTNFEIQAQIRGYIQLEPRGHGALPAEAKDEVAKHLFSTLRGSHNMVFANSRTEVEEYADRLRRISEFERVPNEFVIHHGNLSREIRADVEMRLRERERPCTVVCTSTLEMGIDIGAMKSVAQINPPPSVASLRQRVGRSGRREGEPAIVRMYSIEVELTQRSHLGDQIRASTVQQAAMLSLMLECWYEPAVDNSLHLSTLVQQTLSVIAERSGVRVAKLFSVLCETGPFSNIDKAMFLQVLRDMADHSLIEMSEDGMLLLSRDGERIVNHFSFYAAFSTPDEFRLVEGPRTLGTLPVTFPIQVDMHIIFAGMRWKVIRVDEERKIIELTRAAGGRPPTFAGSSSFGVHREVRQRMLELYHGDTVPTFLDSQAQHFLEDARVAFHRMELHKEYMIDTGSGTTLFLWDSDRVGATLCAELLLRSVRASGSGLFLEIERLCPFDVRALLDDISVSGCHDSLLLASKVENNQIGKHDRFLSKQLLTASVAANCFDVEATNQWVRQSIST